MERMMSNEPGLTDKSALVFGGSRGIGAAIVKQLAADGASVALTYAKSADRAAETARGSGRFGSDDQGGQRRSGGGEGRSGADGCTLRSPRHSGHQRRHFDTRRGGHVCP